jgi:putative transposase
MRPPRIKGFDYRGCHRYSLTCCTRDRCRAFGDATVVALVQAALTVSATVHGFDLLVYCFMPDHMHVLAQGTRDNSSVLSFVRAVRRRSGYAYRSTRHAELWQSGYWDRVLREHEPTAAVRYIAGNPVRAGLVESPLQYSFTGSSVLDLETLLTDSGSNESWRG